MLLPTRMAVLNYLNETDNSDVTQLMNALKKDYGNEKQFNETLYLGHLMALEANGFLELLEYTLSATEELILKYKITPDGRAAVEKYVPANFKTMA